jgi:drug/metabolite transporter (DMT)-like permease
MHAAALPYLELTMIAPTLANVLTVSRARLRAELRPAIAAAGIATFGSYCMVLLALQRAPAAPVAAVRETSVVISAVLAWRYLAEPVGRARVAGAALVACGIALVSLA